MSTMTVQAAPTEHLRAGAAAHLYDAECALSAARATGDDAWIAAAAHKLYQAVVWYEALRAG